MDFPPKALAARKRRRIASRLKQLVKAATSAGLKVTRVEVDPEDKIVIATGPEPAQATLTPLQEWKAKRARAS